jgi:hypothetical protein
VTKTPKRENNVGKTGRREEKNVVGKIRREKNDGGKIGRRGEKTSEGKPLRPSASLRSANSAFGLAPLGLNGNSACGQLGAVGRESMLVACPPPCLSLARRANAPHGSLSARPRGIAGSRTLSPVGFAANVSPSRLGRSSCSLRDIERFAIGGFGSWFRLCRVSRPTSPAASAYEAKAPTGRREARAGASAGGEGEFPACGTTCRFIQEPPAAPPSEAPYRGSILDH